MKRMAAVILAIAVAIVIGLTKAYAGDWRNDGCHGCGPQGWNDRPYYGRQGNGSYGYFAPTPYGNFVGGEIAPPKPPVMVEPFACERHEMVFIPRFNKFACKPVAVPRY